MPAFRVAAAAALAFLSLGASPAIDRAPVRVIYLQGYAFEPSPIRLPAGRPVTLQFVNRAGKSHDFTARKFFRSARILSGRVVDGKIDLGARQSTRVTLIPAAGRYRVHCGRTFHKALGMRSEILVQ